MIMLFAGEQSLIPVSVLTGFLGSGDISAQNLRGTLALLTVGLDKFGLEGPISEVPAGNLLADTAAGM